MILLSLRDNTRGGDLAHLAYDNVTMAYLGSGVIKHVFPVEAAYFVFLSSTIDHLEMDRVVWKELYRGG